MQYLQKYFSVEYGYISIYEGISQNTHNVISTYIRRLYDVAVLQPLKQRRVSTAMQYLEQTNISKILHKASVTLLSLYTRFITKVIITNNLLSRSNATYLLILYATLANTDQIYNNNNIFVEDVFDILPNNNTNKLFKKSV